MLSKNIGAEVRMTFSFSLYTTLLQVVLVAYFGRVLRETIRIKPLKVVRCHILSSSISRTCFYSNNTIIWVFGLP